MRGKSHCQLGAFLASTYFPQIPPLYRRAFLLGCIEPDRNPATYLKGSIRAQWLRGHNYENAKHFMGRIARRLEQKKRWNLLDYYTAGKLIHYTTDAFTYAHNDTFPTQLREHKQYEDALQIYFLSFMAHNPKVTVPTDETIMGAIQTYHEKYERKASDIHRDSRFALNACCCVLATLCLKVVF